MTGRLGAVAALWALMALAARTARPDVVVLTAGTLIEGEILVADNDGVTVKVYGEPKHFERSQVKGVYFGQTAKEYREKTVEAGVAPPAGGPKPADPAAAPAPSAAPVPPAPPPPPPPMSAAELEKGVALAIDKGVEYLKRQQRSDGSFGDTVSTTVYGGGAGKAYPNRPGIAALALLALLKSDVDPGDPAVQRGFQFLRGWVHKEEDTLTTYDIGATLMALESLYEGTAKAMLRKMGKKTAERPGDFKEPVYTLAPADAALGQKLLKRLCDAQSKRGGWRYGKDYTAPGSEEDNSATQFAMLGLKSAVRMRLSVDAAVIRRAMLFVLSLQERDGPKVDRPGDAKPGDRNTYASLGEDRARGWPYIERSDDFRELKATGAMTCAGLTSVLIAKSLLVRTLSKAEGARIDRCVWDGFAWLYVNWTVDENPGSARSHYYYLYGLERVGTLGSYARFGRHVWFREGAEVMVRQQGADGGWDTKAEIPPSNVLDTCFALLFLKRGTVPIGDVLSPRTEPTPAPAPPPGNAGDPDPRPK